MAKAQTITKKDTVYYLVDTIKVPDNDRMIEIGIEGDFYCYRLMCQCYPNQTNPVFTYIRHRKGISLTNIQLSKIKLINLKTLIRLAALHGITPKKNVAYFFIEYKNKQPICHEVVLLNPQVRIKLIN